MPTTKRLYYDDSNQRSFDAIVIRTATRGEHVAVWLDRTAFYPTSGGQPFDTGTLGGLAVVDVQDDDAGEVAHLLAGRAPDVGATLRGEIDWRRRFDHMQQHTGQHLLSAVIERACAARTVSFHLGTDTSTIDINCELTSAQIIETERAANDAIWRDVPVAVRYATEEEARALPLRKESARAGILRLVEIEGIDLSACGGTHVPRTGALGSVVVSSWERFKGGQRIEFLCGGRAVRRFQQLRDMSSASIRLLSVLPGELPDAIERLQREVKEQKRSLVAAQLELAKYEAVALANEAEVLSIGRAVLRVVDGDALRLKALATGIAARPSVVTVLVSRTTPVLAVAARSADLTISCSAIISALANEFSGKGGGTPDLAQCGGLQTTPEHVLAVSRAIIQALTST